MPYQPPVVNPGDEHHHGSTGAYPQQPRRRADFEISIVCALPLEYDAVSLLFDIDWSECGLNPGKAFSDRNTYTTGRIGRHDVVVALLPGMGKVNAAGVAAGLRMSFPNIKIALLTGICGGAPQTQDGDEILLGDVIIANDVVQYDFGRRYPDHFAMREDHGDRLGKPNSEIRGFLATLSTQLVIERLQQRSFSFLRDIQGEAMRRKRRSYKYPGATQDKLFVSSYRHRHYGPSQCSCSRSLLSSDPVCEAALSSLCKDTLCSDSALVPRTRLKSRQIQERGGEVEDAPSPAIFMGRVASGDTVMKSGEDRDRIAREKNVIAFEMEGAGLCDEIPCIIVKGVCDYADSHKNKDWQDFAAATAASVAKAILEIYTSTDRQSTQPDKFGYVSSFSSSNRIGSSAFIPDPSVPSRNSSMFSSPLLSPTLSSRTEDHCKSPTTTLTFAKSHSNIPGRVFFYRFALRSLPEVLQTSLSTKAGRDGLMVQWGTAITEAIKQFPEVPLNLSNTSPFTRFIDGTEKCIWYQVQEYGVETHNSNNLRIEYEEVPLILLKAHETDEERRKKLYRIRTSRRRDLIDKIQPEELVKIPDVGVFERSEMPGEQKGVPERYAIFLFYVAFEITQDDGDLLPFEGFLWSLISQLFLWRPKAIRQLPQWVNVGDNDVPSLEYSPGADQLKLLLRSLLKRHSTPVVITICQAQWLTQYPHTQSVQFLSELYHGQSKAGVSVHLIASAANTSPVLPLFNPAQILSRDTERHECLNEFAFEGQFLRRDEVAAADKGTNDWIWSHISFCSWRERPSGILWIEGKAGSGKSVLAKTIRSNLSQLDGFTLPGVPLPPISDWFFSSRHGAVNKSHCIGKKKEDQHEWDFEDYEIILKELAANGLPAVCIVDAMDESEDSGGSYDLRARIISLMADLCCVQESRIRFVVLSRYTADIDRALHKYLRNTMSSRIWLERENVSDIATLVENALSTVRSAMSIYESDEDEEVTRNARGRPTNTTQTESMAMDRMREYLIENADGVILWVILATQALIGKIRSGFYSLELVESELKALPRGIIDFYKLTLRDLESRYSPQELERTRTALMWVVGASYIRPLVLNELYEALCIPVQSAIQSNVDPIAQSPLRIHAKSWLGFYRQLRVRCGPFIEVIIPETQDFRLSFSQGTEISPHFTVQLLHRTVKDFLHNKNESGALAFTQVEAEDLVRKSMKTYLELVLPINSTMYCPVPVTSNQRLGTTVENMAHYLEKKYLLEFVLTALPEHETIPHLMIFETSVFPPLMEQRDHWPWDEALKTISSQYFEFVCQEGLVEAMANLLSIASNLLLSWPTLLRYGPLASALQKCSNQFSNDKSSSAAPEDNIHLTPDRKLIVEAIELMTQFSRREQDLSWECRGVHGDNPPLVPSILALRNAVEEVQISYGKRLRSRRENSQESPVSLPQPSNRESLRRTRGEFNSSAVHTDKFGFPFYTQDVAR
ncbi:hypothetical protein NUW58_g4165 [Xylaria curta]|uniref:Uncharacterized protein n=1 Tax=Xylaria curta TaxID=42375 RepID=A0ACC1P7L5_9PEZI|nr:hypothetical protein NUW58_g4165 [Xylaria curta]